MTRPDFNIFESARRVIELEAEAVLALNSVLGPEFERAISVMMACRGRVIATGMGKAGHIARKIAATLASTGTPAFYLHPAEAVHGDLGMVTADDVALAFSHQGQTEEVLRVVPYLKHVGARLIAITSNAGSELARLADVSLALHVPREACPLDLAPTASTTAMLALGDTLALVLLEARGFTHEDFALYHPGGTLGRRLLTRVSDLMHTGDANPVVHVGNTLQESVIVMTSKKLASTSVVDDDGKLVGFFSDGDLRRCFARGAFDASAKVKTVMTKNPKFARPEMMAVKALEILREFKIIELPVCDDTHRPIGMIHLHDITAAGIS